MKGAQHTVIWHVDDLKCSHVDPFVNTLFAKWLSSIYGPKIREKRGKIHDYLGVDFDWSEPGKCKVSMIKYLANVIEEFPEKIDKTATTGGGDNLYKIRDPDDPKLPHDFYLPEKQAQAFHHTLAQLLFVSQWPRRDLQPYVSFLSKRVKRPDQDNWEKMKWLLQYVKGTLHMKLTLKIVTAMWKFRAPSDQVGVSSEVKN